MLLKTFGGSFAVTILGLGAAMLYGGPTGLAIAAILIILEISLSFDNAVVNATVLERLSPFWQKLFLTLGIAIAVVGMRLVFPLVIVGVTAKLNPVEAVQLALEKGDPHTPGTYGYLMHDAHSAIAAFGGVFLLMLFLNFVFEERELKWLSWLERPLARVGKLEQLAVVVSMVAVAVAAYAFAPEGKTATVLVSGILGVVTYILVNGLGEVFESDEDGPEVQNLPGIHGSAERLDEVVNRGGNSQLAVKVGKAAFFSFLYLEVLDASFSFDGVIGAFAITNDPIIMAIGLGVGALYVRSLTVFLVRKGTLSEYVYLEHGAQWAIGALAACLLISIKYEIPEVVTGLVGVGLIAAAFVSSIVRNRRNGDSAVDDDSRELVSV
ncbi:hypothetical protein SAMN05444365_102182 [Micromonospora pattaloongensis]|uniref:Integral membrane protein, YkoY family n=1 Tax=Micromonospora pattaloongensis TaxID=405436 RepID=A0A1H3JMH9_9ACTN|nr:DUF475 domain-containing protein [Micromonospora pattaloongensis]SDY41133.1 hypothetical protein SAMN05444365_102182 [Micromonospora pattaloongensis]